MSTRLGRTKQLIELRGKTLVEWAVDAALGSELEKVVLVVGHEAGRVLARIGERIRDPRLEVAVAADYQQGMGCSLRAGFDALKDAFPSIMFLLGDQPLVDAEVIDYLLTAFRLSDKNILVPVRGGRPGNPTIFGKTTYSYFEGIGGDAGARHIIKDHPTNVHHVPMGDVRCFLDIDTEDDLEAARRLMDGGAMDTNTQETR